MIPDDEAPVRETILTVSPESGESPSRFEWGDVVYLLELVRHGELVSAAKARSRHRRM